MGGYDLGEIFMMFGFSLWFCPSLLALPVWLWAWWRKPSMRNKRVFVVGMGVHVLNVLIAIGIFWWLKDIASNCRDCLSGLHLFLVLPITWLLFVCGATCNVVGLRQPSVADGKRSASKEEIPEYSLFGDAFYDKQRCRVGSLGMLLLSVTLLVLLKPTINTRDENA